MKFYVGDNIKIEPVRLSRKQSVFYITTSIISIDSAKSLEEAEEIAKKLKSKIFEVK